MFSVKLLMLVRSRFKQYMENNRAAFIFYLIGSITCGVILLYVYGNTVPALKAVKGDDMRYRSYEISFFDEEKQDVIAVDVTALDEMVQNWPFQGELSNPEFLLKKMISEEDYPDGIIQTGFTIPTIEAEYFNQIYLDQVKGQVQFMDDHLNEEYPPTILPNTMKLKDPNKELFQIEQSQYKVIGIYSGTSSVIIPYETFLEQYDDPDSVSVRFSSIVDHSKIGAEIESYVHQYFPDTFIQPPFNSKPDPVEMTLILVILGALYGLALSSISFISTYMFEKNRSTNIIYRMIGCSNKMLVLIGFVETALLAIGTMMISIGIHIVFYRLIFSKINLTEGIQYLFTDYILMSIVMVIVAMILYLPKIRGITKETVQSNRIK